MLKQIVYLCKSSHFLKVHRFACAYCFLLLFSCRSASFTKWLGISILRSRSSLLNLVFALVFPRLGLSKISQVAKMFSLTTLGLQISQQFEIQYQSFTTLGLVPVSSGPPWTKKLHFAKYIVNWSVFSPKVALKSPSSIMHP